MPATPRTPLWTAPTAPTAGGGGGAGGAAGRRRKTLSPSKALSFLASSFEGDAENVPPPAALPAVAAGPGAIKSLIKVCMYVCGGWMGAAAVARDGRID